MRSGKSDAAGRDLAAECQHALIERARAEAAGTRQQLRAAARRFVRKHRRDDAYLRWVLRSVGASSALALALLGFGAQPAHAGFTPFVAGTLAGVTDVGSSSSPALGDLDGDGDPDLVVGESSYEPNGPLNYFENTQTGIAAFVQRTGSQNPFEGQQFDGGSPTPALADLDADGDLDLVVGTHLGVFAYLENTGSPTSAAFLALTGAANPLAALGDLGSDVSATLGDIDADGDLDLVAGEYAGTFFYFENTGDATNPLFVQRTGSANPLDGQDVGFLSRPALVDLDRDGDLDLVAGKASGSFSCFENNRSAVVPRFVAITGTANPLFGSGIGLQTQVAFADLDRDADLDLVSGELYGTLSYFEQLDGFMVLRTGAGNPLDPIVIPGGGAPALGDLDSDGDLDLIAGRDDGTFRYFKNTGSATIPRWAEGTGFQNPLNGDDVGFLARPALGDLDADGDLDLVVGDTTGVFHYFQNTGFGSAVFVERTGASNPLDGFDVGNIPHPTLGDLDGDGDLDLISGNNAGTFDYFENTGSAAVAAFVENSAGNPMAAFDVGSASRPSLVDLDGDHDLDVVVGSGASFDYFYRGTGGFFNAVAQNSLPFLPVPGSGRLFAAGDLDADGDADLVAYAGTGFDVYESQRSIVDDPRTGASNPLNGVDAGNWSAPAFGDVDADGDMDLVTGLQEGTFAWILNLGSAIQPNFVILPSVANPLDGQDVGTNAHPALGDLDADGDLDLVVGKNVGSFAYLENTGDATSAAFALRTGASDPLDGIDVGDFSAPALGDLDADGDLDLVVGRYEGDFRYFENTGDLESPAFLERTGPANPFAAFVFGILSDPALGDLDRDGDLDLLAGHIFGTFAYFENVDSATDPIYLQQTGAQNPLDGRDTGNQSTPTLGDLDGDGDLDVVNGEMPGTFETYYLPEPGQGALLGAGIALLRWLRRRRGRS